MIKETLNIISSDPSCKDRNAWFKPLSDNNAQYIVVFLDLKCLIPIYFSAISHFLRKIVVENDQFSKSKILISNS